MNATLPSVHVGPGADPAPFRPRPVESLPTMLSPARARRRIIDLLLTREPLSRAEIARLTALSKPTISSIIPQLITEGIVHEIGTGASTGGRNPILLALRSTTILVAGVELDVAGCTLFLVTLHGEQIARVDLPLASTRVETVVETVATGIEGLLDGKEPSTLLGCGIAVPGLVDPAGDTVASPTRLGWQAVPLRELLEARIGVPVFVTDRGKSAGLGELWSLGPDKPDDLVYLYLGRGVAGAIVLHRDILPGTTSTAGELGHMIIDPDGPACECGNRGCLEALVSTPAILARVQSLLATGSGEPSAAPTWVRSRDADTIAAIGEAAMAGDPLALALVGHVARWLGIALASLVNILNPSLVVLGGPVAEWGDPLIEAVVRELATRALPIPGAAVRVVTGHAHDLAVLIGATALVLQRAGELLSRPNTLTTSVGMAAPG